MIVRIVACVPPLRYTDGLIEKQVTMFALTVSENNVVMLEASPYNVTQDPQQKIDQSESPSLVVIYVSMHKVCFTIS